MRPVTAAFLRTIRGSHQMVARARVLTTWQVGTNPLDPGVALADCTLPIDAGDVRSDATAAVRSTLAMVTTAAWSTRGPITVFGNEVFVERGLNYGGGHTEWVSQGYFRLYDVEQDTAPSGPLRLAGRDRMSGIVDARLLTPVQFDAGATIGPIVEQLVTEVYPAAVIDWDDDTATQTLARAHVADDDRYAFLDQLISSYGKVWYWDHRGHLVIRTPPDPTDPVWDVNAGAGGVLIRQARRISREGSFNAVVATGQGGDTASPARAVVVDLNPQSSTYWHGPFGKVPRFYTSPFLTTDLQAQTAAEALLRQAIGLPYAVDFSTVPNPALEVLDPVRTTTSDGAETHVLQTTVIPLTAQQEMTATTREQTLVIVGSA